MNISGRRLLQIEDPGRRKMLMQQRSYYDGPIDRAPI